MELGQRLRQARQEAGLTQKALCGDEITRNMLSQIENGSARPSMETMRFLAQRLGKPVSWFLEEETVISPNQAVMASARAAFEIGDYGQVRQTLEAYQGPDEIFDWEQWFLSARAAMALAEQAVAQGRLPYAVRLLELAGEEGARTPYFGEELEARRRLLLARTGQAVTLGGHDEELMIRAEALLEQDALRAGAYLDAAEDRRGSRWMLLRGQAYLALERHREAAECFRMAQGDYPREAARALEQCCRALEDYKGAYEYACKLRELER